MTEETQGTNGETPLEKPQPEQAGTESPQAAASPVVGYCRTCGKGLREGSVFSAQGTIYCQEHVPLPATPPPPPGATEGHRPDPAAASSGAASASAAGSSQAGPSAGGASHTRYEDSPYTRPTPPPAPPLAPNHDVSPGLAFALGLIPGVGAIYNGQYAKGLVHVFILGMLFTATDSANNLEVVFALLIPGFWFYMAFEAYHTARNRRMGYAVDEFSGLLAPGHSSKLPLAPVLLIVFGVIFLLDNLDLLNIRDIVVFWPLLMILAGAYMLYVRLAPPEDGRGGGSQPPFSSGSGMESMGMQREMTSRRDPDQGGYPR